jgi:ParB family chromosome partitioning protein
VTQEECLNEIATFSTYGQLIPVLGRPLLGESDFDYELIYGARRLFVARYLDTHLLVDVRDLTDRQALLALDIENRLRKDISPYERGVGYMRWLRAGHFESQEQLAKILQVSTSQVSRLLKLARLPSVVVGAFDTPGDICESWGVSLADALEDPKRRASVIRAARAISQAGERQSSHYVFRRLLCSSTGRRRSATTRRDLVITGESGAPLFRVRYLKTTVAVILPMQSLSRHALESIRTGVAQVLESGAGALKSGARVERTSHSSVPGEPRTTSPVFRTGIAR